MDTSDPLNIFKGTEKLLETAHGAWKAQVLSTAIDLKLFDFLETEQNRGKAIQEIRDELQLKGLRVNDFLDSLVGMGHICKVDGLYSNSKESSQLCVTTSPFYIGAVLSMRGSSNPLVSFAGLNSYLLTNVEAKLDFAEAYDNIPEMTESFANYMRGCVTPLSYLLPAYLKDFWLSVNNFADIGGGSGFMSIQLCKQLPHLRGLSCDLKQTKRIFDNYISKESDDIKSRVQFRFLDFFADELPSDADVLMFGNVLHDWNDHIKILLMRKAFDSLQSGGYILIYDFFLEEGKEASKLGNHLMSLHMQLICGGSQFTSKELEDQLSQIGFQNFQFFEVDRYQQVLIGRKP